MKFLLCIFSLLSTLMITSVNENQFINVFEQPQVIELTATFNKSACNNKAYVAIDLPKNATGFIYSISPIGKKDSEVVENRLINKVNKLSKKHEANKIADYILPGKSNKSFNLYFMQESKNVQSFFNCGCYKYVEKHIRTKMRTGYVESINNEEPFYIGIEKIKDLKRLNLKLEVVAVVR